MVSNNYICRFRYLIIVMNINKYNGILTINFKYSIHFVHMNPRNLNFAKMLYTGDVENIGVLK